MVELYTNQTKNAKKNMVGDHTTHVFKKKKNVGNRDFFMLSVNGWLFFFLVHHFGVIACALNPWLAQVLLVPHVQNTPNKGSHAI